MKKDQEPASFPMSPEPKRISGLPDLKAGDQVLLTSGGDLVIAKRGKVSTYSIGGKKCRKAKLHQFKEPVTAIVETSAGLVFAAGGALHLAGEEGVTKLAELEGPVTSLVAAGASVFAAVGRNGRLDGSLLEVDAARSVIVSERSLRSAAVKLTVDPGGNHLGISDGASFVRMMVAGPPPCPGRSEPERPTEPDPCDCHGKGRNKPGAHDEDDGTAENSGHPSSTDGRQLPHEPCDPGRSGVPTPDGGAIVGDNGGVSRMPPGGIVPWDPCHVHLFFEVHDVRLTGSLIIAADREGRNLAILSADNLAILHQAQYRRGAVLLSNHSQDQMLVYEKDLKLWGKIEFGDVSPIGSIDIFNPTNPGIADTSITFTGSPMTVMKGDRAAATGTRTILVIPTLDPGQAFNDADLPKLAGYLQRAGFSKVTDYYKEASFNTLTQIDFRVHGVHVGQGGPIRLPKPIGDYYFPAYVGAHVEFTKTGLGYPGVLLFDGRETLSLKVQPMTGGRPASTLNLRFPALLAAQSHKLYPAEIKFLGTEKATIVVKRPGAAATQTLALNFTAKTFTFTDAASFETQKDSVATYFQGVLAAAESAASISPSLFEKPSVERIYQEDDGPGFIVTRLYHALKTGPKLEVHKVTYTGGSDPLGLSNSYTGRLETFDGIALRGYVDFVATLAQEEAGHHYPDRRLANDMEVKFDVAANTITTKIYIVPEDGGPGATMTITDSNEMMALYDSSKEVANTDVTYSRSLTPKDGNDGFDGLIDDVYTAVVDRQALPGKHLEKKKDIEKFFEPYDGVMIGAIFPAINDPKNADTVQPYENWYAGPTSWTVQRAVEGPRTALFRPHPAEIQYPSNWSFIPFSVPADFPLMCHEFGHAIGLDDLYASGPGFRTDLLYMEGWAMMHVHGARSHHCGYHKWQSGWIPDGRVLTIERPPEDQEIPTEFLLVPIEHWHLNDTLVGKAKNVFGRQDLEVVQLAELVLGGNADVFGLIEARQVTSAPSMSLPLNPAVLITNCIVWWDKNRYAFNGRYRTAVHPLHSFAKEFVGKPFHAKLQNAGESFDCARGCELPMKGITVTVVDRKTVDGVEVFHMKVVRKHSKEFIDLFFTSAEPEYKNPDVWVDCCFDNGPGGKSSSTEKKDMHVYPPGQPIDQGEKIQVPPSGTEPHWIACRIRNIGNVRAENVELNFSVCDPPGAGDRGNFNVRATEIIQALEPTGMDKPVPAGGLWQIPAGFKGHTCVMVEVADYRIPLDHTGAALASDDVWQASNRAQKNVDQIGPKANSPYEPVEFKFSVNNSGQWPEVAYLEPQGLPYGMKLTVRPRRRRIDAGETAIFRCKLELDDTVIDNSCRGDHDFRINAWRVTKESAVKWGGVEYQVRPRKKSDTDLTGSWYEDEVEITGHVDPSNVEGKVRIRLAYSGNHAKWVSVDLQPGAVFSYKEKAPGTAGSLLAMALFEGNQYYSESRSPERHIVPPPPLH